MAGGGAAGAGGFMAGAIGGAAAAAASQTVLSVGNHIAFGDPLMTPKQFAFGIATGALLGGTVNGISALRNGRTFWNGTAPRISVQPVTLPNAGAAQGQSPEIKSDLSLQSTQATAAPTTQADRVSKVIVTKNVDGGYQVENAIDKELSKQLQAKFKHASDFGVEGSYNKTNLAKFGSAIDQHMNSLDIQIINGTYRGQSVIHYLNPNNGLNVITTPSGQFLSGWKLNSLQLSNVLNRGSL